ncbi:hypothetical protein [Spirulina sp. 06S082]|uniref:hypothetical protein n=1 Tax=Spirulina sp. 06S082 TaxID=3110248 RepID=UPI002B2198E7|nr:hypothetical protein [Spirulina sp. 06S082]MEA5467757.1 hypothetical protein [Spirulina sp. 06S082]
MAEFWHFQNGDREISLEFSWILTYLKKMKKCDRPHSLLFHLLMVLTLMVLPLQGGCTSQVDSTATENPASVQSSSQDTSNSALRQIPAIVKTVEVDVLESEPLQLSLKVTGNFQDGCKTALKKEQKQDGTQINVALYRELPTDTICPTVITPFQETILLEGDFPSGTYTIDVNGIIVEQTI